MLRELLTTVTTVEIKEIGWLMKLSSPCDSIQQTPIWDTAPHPAANSLAPRPVHSTRRAGESAACTEGMWEPRLSRSTMRGSDQLPFRTPRKPHGGDTKSPGEGGLLEKGKKEQYFVSSHRHNGKTNRDKLWQHSIFCKAVICFTEWESHGREGQRCWL